MSVKSALIDPSWVRILIVDDEEMVLGVLKEQLQPEGYHITTTDSPSKALDILQRENFAVLLADQEMPGMTGLEFLNKTKETHPATTRLLISTGLTLAVLSEAIKSDVIYRFITKPWLREELLVTLRNAIVHNRLITENKALHERNVHLNLKISRMAEAEEAAAAEKSEESEAPPQPVEGAEGGEGTSATGAVAAPQGVEIAVESFNKMLYTFHPNLGNTSLRAVALCETLGEVLELPSEQVKSLIWAAALHDIALVGIDRPIVRRWLRGPEKCTDEELVLIKKHPAHGQQILESFPFLKDAGEIIRWHHEHWDGSGYPDALKGEMIPWLARLLCVVVAYCSKHSTSIQAMSEIELEEEKMFDPDAVLALAKAAPLTKMPRGEREKLLIELKPGDVLAREILNANGFPLFPKNTEMTEQRISKVFGINRQSPIDQLVLVYC